MNYALLLKELTDCLINDNTTWIEKKNSLHKMAELFASMDVYDIQNAPPTERDDGVALANGYAISQWGAAMCLMEISRTKAFVAGIIQAIKDQLAVTTERPLQIIDAGCGPFALLSVLPSLYFLAEEVQFHLLDIIPENTLAAKKLIHALGVEDKFGNVYNQDATKFLWPSNLPLHMVISETMLNALRKEPQVAITMNLAPQLSPTGVFIPEKIEVDLVIVKPNTPQEHSNSNKAFQTNIERIDNVMTVTKNSFTRWSDSIELSKITIPQNYNPGNDSLSLYTKIFVYKDIVLANNDCSLTLPLILSTPFKNKFEKNTQLFFSYTIIDPPGIKYRLMN